MRENGRERQGVDGLEQDALVIDQIGLGSSVISRSKECVERTYEVHDAGINEISVAAQMRSEFPKDSIIDLAASINSSGLHHPLHVCRMDADTAKAYIEYTNDLWGRNVTFDSFVPVSDSDTEEYDVLIMGERRLRALNMLDEYVEGNESTKIYRWKTEGRDGFAFLTAAQAAENLHEMPDSFKFAMAAYALFKTGEYPSVAAFVKGIGGSIGSSRAYNAVTFFGLPEEVRVDVEEGKLVYTTAIEIARYQQALSGMLMDYKVENYGKSNKLKAIDEIPEETINAMQREVSKTVDANVVVMSRHTISNNMSAERVARARSKWIEEVRYLQMGLAGMSEDTISDSLERVDASTAKYLRELLNNAARSTERTGEALHSVFALLGNQENAGLIRRKVESNVLRVMVGQTAVYEAVARDYSGRKPSEVAMRLIEILELHPDTSLDDATNLNLSD